jgi:hypothetical protein
MTLLTTTKFKIGVFLVLFIWVEVVEARLIRTSGRGTYQDQYSEAVYYVPNQYLNDMGIDSKYMDAFHPEYVNVPGLLSDVNARTGGFEGLDAVPNECTKGVIESDRDELESEIWDVESLIYDGMPDAERQSLEAELAYLNTQFNELYTNDPCIWEFEQGEDLFAWGGFSFFFDSTDVNYDVDWYVSNGSQSWVFNGSINTSTSLLDPNDPSKTIAQGSVLLNTSAPVDLVPGDYSVRVSVALSSDAGSFIYESDNHPSGPYSLEEQCRENDEFNAYADAYNEANGTMTDAEFDVWLANNPEPPFEICGYGAYKYVSSGYPYYYDSYELITAPTSFYSVSETLRILPTSTQGDQIDAVNANAPASFGLFCLGIGGLFYRRRKTYQQ